MPPRGVKSAKRKRQYNKIKQSARSRGASTGRAKQIAARTVNKQRRKTGETTGSKSRRSETSGKSARSRSGSRGGTSSGRGRSSGSKRSSSSSRSRRSGGSKKK